MKRIISVFLLCATVLLTLPGFAFADNGKSKTIPLKKEKRHETDVPIDESGHRMPSAPVLCVINESGISVDGIDGSQIYLYEVYDANGAFKASFSLESNFISFIFNANEDMKLRFHTDSFIFSGWWLQ